MTFQFGSILSTLKQTAKGRSLSSGRPSLSPSVDSPLKTLTQKHKDFYFTIILVAYINGIVERFGMGNYVLVVPGFSGQYLLPFIFSQDPQIDTGHNLSGLITISPGTRSSNQLASRL